MLRRIGIAGAVLSVVLSVNARGAVVVDTVVVGNLSNAADTATGHGSVDYEYRIAKTEITHDQYAEFLRAVAESDPNGVYPSSSIVHITQGGVDGGYTYAVEADYGNKPVHLTWFQAARFANWMHNGQPSGAQSASTTEDGAYDMSQSPDQIVRKAGAITRRLNEQDGQALDKLLVRLVMETDEAFPPRIVLSSHASDFLGYQHRFWARWKIYERFYEGVAHRAKQQSKPAKLRDERRIKLLMAEVERRGAADFPGLAVEVLTVWHTRHQMADASTPPTKAVVDRWRAFIENMAEQESLTGDQRARWYMARAYTEELAYWEPTPLLGRSWLDRALATAESDELKIEIVEWMAQGLTVLHRFEEARQLIAETSDRLNKPEMAVRLARVNDQIQAGELGHQAQTAALANMSRARQLAELDRRLQAARAKGDREGIARYERLLQKAR